MQDKTERRFRIVLEDRKSNVTQEMESNNLFFAIADGDGENTEAYGSINHGSDVVETLALLGRVNRQFKEFTQEVYEFLGDVIETSVKLNEALDPPQEYFVEHGRIVKTREGKYLLNELEIREGDEIEIQLDGEWISAIAQTLDGEAFAVMKDGRFEPLIGAAVRIQREA